jgi:diamine N-acetyltransferase
MNFAVQQAIEAGKKACGGVWERNADAIAFYEKMGFREAGRHSFRMGEEFQPDLIMKNVLD